MMDKIQIEELIDRFIQNEMTASEREKFSLLLEEDEKLREQVAIRYSLSEGMLQAAEQKARQALERPVRQNRYKIVQWAAIAFVILTVGGGAWFGNSPAYSSQDVYLHYFTIPVIERARGGNGLKEEVAIVNDQIISWYEAENYTNIVELFGKTDSRMMLNDLPDYALLYIGISLLEQNNANEALSVFSQINSPEYQEEVDWLLLCCYLNGNERQKAIEQAIKIETNGGEYAHAANLIRDDLKKKEWF